MVGTGPWEQVSYSPNNSLTLKRFTGYWGPKTATANLEVLYVPVSSTEVTDLEAHKVDLIVATEAAIASLKGVRGVKTTAVSSDTVAGLQLYTHAAPFNNVDVRRAVAVAVNRSALAAVAYDGGASPSGAVPPSYSWSTPFSKLAYASYDPAEAKKLLSEGGYPHGLSVTLKYITGYDWGTNSLVQQVASELGAVGINVTLVPLDVAAWVQATVTTGDYQIGWNEYSSYSNPYLYVSIQPNPGRGSVPPALVKLQNEALSSSPAGFEAGINRITAWQFDNAWPNVNLLALDTYAAYLAGVSNVNVQSSGSTQYLAEVKVS
jgi:ABC-type transport system substrate-binding protein